MSALCAAARHGFEMPDALKIAEKTYVGLGVNIHDDSNKQLQESLEQLPDSCVAAAKELQKDREIYTSKGVFSENIVDFMIKYLNNFNDANLRAELGNDTEKIMKLVNANMQVG
jgi:glutamine synthetase